MDVLSTASSLSYALKLVNIGREGLVDKHNGNYSSPIKYNSMGLYHLVKLQILGDTTGVWQAS